VKRLSSLAQGYEAQGAQDQFLVGGNIVSVRGAGLTGTATIAANAKSVTVAHSLGNGLTPRVFVTPLQDMTSYGEPFITGKSATQFTINIHSSAGSALQFDWSVTP